MIVSYCSWDSQGKNTKVICHCLVPDEMVEWHHLFDGHEFEQTPGVGVAWRAEVHRVAKSQTQLTD